MLAAAIVNCLPASTFFFAVLLRYILENHINFELTYNYYWYKS
jgi:hypothetical protein